MTHLFGPVAGLYDDVRPGYPGEVADAVLAYHGRTPASVADVGAGTGKATELLLRLGAPVTCVEPDEGMAAVLRSRFPSVRVVTSTFENWSPAGGVDVIGCGLAWHWLDPATRNRHAAAALTPGGTLAVFAHTYGYADPADDAVVTGVLSAVDPGVAPRPAHWLRDDLSAAGELGDVRERVWHTYPVFSRARFLQLVQTFSPFLRHSAADRRAVLEGLDAGLGDTVTLDLTTTLVLGRR